MNMTSSDFEAIEKALNLLPSGEEFNKLDKQTQDTIINAYVVMVKLTQKRKKSNAKTAQYIADRRKTNKNYAR